MEAMVFWFDINTGLMALGLQRPLCGMQECAARYLHRTHSRNFALGAPMCGKVDWVLPQGCNQIVTLSPAI